MSLWTQCQIIPVLWSSDSYSKSTIFEGKIWTVCEIENDDSYQTRIFVFDLVSEVLTEVNCIYPAVWPKSSYTFIAAGSDLYIWRGSGVSNGTDRHLYRLNRATLEWEYIMTRRGGFYGSVVIIDQVMHILETDQGSYVFSLTTIDLVKKEVVNSQQLPNPGRDRFLTIHDNNLYLIEDDNDRRSLYEVKNDGLIRLIRTEREEPNLSCWKYSPVHSINSDGYVGIKNRKFEFHTLDFELLNWKYEFTTPDGPVQKYAIRIRNVVKVEQSIYVLGAVRRGENRQLELHVLDLDPKLTSICLEDLSNRLFEKPDEEKLDDVIQQLPIPLRAKLEELMEWKKNANQLL